MDDKSVWTIKREVQYWDDKKLTSADGFLLECPFGHPLAVRADPPGALRHATVLPCPLCPNDEGQQPEWKLPPELGPPAWDRDDDED